jgi:CRISPR-associated protein Cas2
MTILICEKVPDSLRGELSRWMIEPKTNVFVGRMSAMVRDRLWKRVQEKLRGGAAILAYPTNNEQGFTIRSCGDTTRELVNYDGLMLVKVPTVESKARKQRLEWAENTDEAPEVIPNPTAKIRQMLIEAGENPELW